VLLNFTERERFYNFCQVFILFLEKNITVQKLEVSRYFYYSLVKNLTNIKPVNLLSVPAYKFLLRLKLIFEAIYLYGI